MGKASKFDSTNDRILGEERVVVGVDDLVLLRQVNENGVLENLKIRHAADIIYCYIGQVLVVVNPYKWLNIYDESTMKAYVYKARIDVAPHVFAIAEETYRTMLSEEENQCIIISGESGAGKTEASKQIQNYIANISGSGEGVDKIKRTFLESNPLLEAFGNAKTLRNNNSSRFGKYFELYFNSIGCPLGGKITNYLLEKSRVIKPGQNERNFHIFYQLLAGLPIVAKKKLYLDEINQKHFQILNVTGCFEIEEINDQQEFEETIQAMQHVGIKRKQIELIFQIISAILHLGNIKFQSKSVQDTEGSIFIETTRKHFDIFCELIGVDDTKKLEKALCFKKFETMAPGGQIEIYQVPQNSIQAKNQSDSIAKNIYSKMFDFLIERINHALFFDQNLLLINQQQNTKIGILDIYGFEIFSQNGFEQFCINYVNEKLQQIFIELTLKTEQEEYIKEEIEWKNICFFNNKIVCDLIEAKKPIPGIFFILEDTIKTMHSCQGEIIDQKFLEKMFFFHQNHAHFFKRGIKTFEIQHYAGNVQYQIEGFSDATKDFLTQEITNILSQSKNKLIKYLFFLEQNDKEEKEKEKEKQKNKKLPHTAAYKIRTQCEILVNTLMDCTPHYVRCIKSNDQKQPNKIDDRRVIHQIKYLGLVENIKVRRAGYAYRGDYGRFLDRFKLLSKETYPEYKGKSDKKGCQAILRSVVKKLPILEKEVQFGKTKLFIQTPETFFQLENLREKTIGFFVSKIQKIYRKYSSQRHLLTLSHEITKLYQLNKKERQRVSIYRPFDGIYLKEEKEKKEIFALIQHYDKDLLQEQQKNTSIINMNNNSIVFMDHVYKIVPKKKNTSTSTTTTTSFSSSSSSPSSVVQNEFSTAYDVINENPLVTIEARILILTNSALYLVEKRNWDSFHPDHPKNTWIPPNIYMRRRIPLKNIEEIILSTRADPFFILKVTPENFLEEIDKSHWVDDKAVLACMETGKKFGLFHRRHHCRYTGKIYCNDVCKQLEVVPDRGVYSPQRVHDSSIGRICTEMLEDQMLLSEKKTEITVMLVDTIKKFTNRLIPITFQDRFHLRIAPIVALSKTPSQQFLFLSNPSLHSSTIKIVAAAAAAGGGGGGNGDANIIQIQVPSGVPEEYIRKRRKRERARRKKLEQQREEEQKIRAMRREQREKMREEERLRRVAEKKAKKKAEKEAKHQLAIAKSHSKARMENVRKFGESVVPNSNNPQASLAFGGANSELAAILARRRGEAC